MGLVEALTEYLPVSSTGHLILTSHLLGIEQSDFHAAFEIVIQGGSILAVIWHYRKLLLSHLSELFSGSAKGRDFFLKLFVAFCPAAIVGLLFHKQVKAYLFGPIPVVIALVVGGIIMIALERRLKHSAGSDEEITIKGAFFVGVAQIFSLWPGTSRSMTTLLGGRFMGLSPYKAAEFSFLLAIPIILAATGYELLKVDVSALSENLDLLLVGTGVSFVASLFVIRIFLGFLKKHSLEVFGWYRIVAGLLYYFFIK